MKKTIDELNFIIQKIKEETNISKKTKKILVKAITFEITDLEIQKALS